jgi:cytochrome c oxidase cbb3-type subunit 1
MFNPYFLMTILYISLALLGALDAALINFDRVVPFSGLRWMRIHFITLGALTEFAFGILPILASSRKLLRRPKFRWDIWGSLNLGLLILLIGIPIYNKVMIISGGTLIFIAVLLMVIQLVALRAHAEDTHTAPHGRKFYVVGLVYLLLGIIIGTGLWQGWSAWLQIKVPIEVHIHANNWGFMSLIFAGLLVDLYPSFTGRSFAHPRTINLIFWGMTVGALGLILGPWFKSNLYSVPGLILHLSATILLLFSIIKPLIGDRQLWKPGMLHIITSYIWILAPVLVAPLIILEVPGFPGAGIEQNAPQALIYGWVLQFGYAIIPHIFRQVLLTNETPKLCGNWLSLLAVHIGGVFLWIGIFMDESQAFLHGTAYSLWFISMVPIVYELWQIFRKGLDEFVNQEVILLPTIRK